mmetsp:Transcript_9017/g.10611  ORF Transcript_9017/g.10611 Transcript_9017/m.10611 type:complete len:157 (+) Transcript_9017:287-757(+)
MKKHVQRSYKKENADDLVSIKLLVANLRKKLNVFDEISNFIFRPIKPSSESLNAIKFFNSAKKVLIRSGGPDRKINLRIFNGLIHELRIKFDIFKAGLGPEKIMSLIDYDGPPSSAFQSMGEKGQKKRQMRIERIVFSEFNTINMAKVQSAILQAE